MAAPGETTRPQQTRATPCPGVCSGSILAGGWGVVNMVAWEAVSANRVWKQLLRDYEQPPMDPAIDEELRDYVARAKVEMGTNP